MKSLLILFGIFLFTISRLAAQEFNDQGSLDHAKKISIHGSVGSLGLYFSATGKLEFLFYSTQNKKLTLFARGGFGGFATYGDQGTYLLIEPGLLIGAKNSHLEFSTGLNIYLNDGEFVNFPLSGTLGYRYQKWDGKLLFRAGIAWPEGVYLGLGLLLGAKPGF